MFRTDPNPSSARARDDDAFVAIDADPNDPGRCTVRFGAHGPRRSIGASGTSVAAFLEGDELIQRALPELDADDREFLLYGLEGDPLAPNRSPQPTAERAHVVLTRDRA